VSRPGLGRPPERRGAGACLQASAHLGGAPPSAHLLLPPLPALVSLLLPDSGTPLHGVILKQGIPGGIPPWETSRGCDSPS
jgi:hypothetical protein